VGTRTYHPTASHISRRAVGNIRLRLVACALVLAVPLIRGLRPGTAAPATPPTILVFTRTTGYRHASIPAAVAAVRAIGRRDGFVVGATEDPRAFSDAALHRVRAVAFLLTSGTVLDADQRGALDSVLGRSPACR